MSVYSASSIAELLADHTADISKRYNAIFEARSFLTDEATVEAIKNLLDGFKTKSVLLRHEACYVLGQVGHLAATERLRKILADDMEHEITRHEAIEALAAIGDIKSIDLIDSIANSPDSTIPMKETCILALNKLKKSESGVSETSNFNTKDPINIEDSSVVYTTEDIQTLRDYMLADSTSLQEKYETLFKLRNVKDPNGEPSMEAARAVAYLMKNDRSSALFRHELAFVLAQMAFGRPDDQLIELVQECFTNEQEHSMVRHEAAIALGSIGGKKSKLVLAQYIEENDPTSAESSLDQQIVLESCQVSLESLKYWESFTSKE
jgi:deoxyhypusine monooxygenase